MQREVANETGWSPNQVSATSNSRSAEVQGEIEALVGASIVPRSCDLVTKIKDTVASMWRSEYKVFSFGNTDLEKKKSY